MADKQFPNGFTNWMETFYEVATFIEARRNRDDGSEIAETQESQGTGGMYELAEKWTDEFEVKHKGREWDGEFFDELEEFCTLKNLNGHDDKAASD